MGEAFRIHGSNYMASDTEIRQYVAHWFQLGKGIKTRQGNLLKPQTVFRDNRYTPEFEQCWQAAIAEPESYLEGTDQTLKELLSDRWELVDCARCAMPIPMVAAGLPQQLGCPCHDLPNWPNNQLPMPRSPIEVTEKTLHLRHRIASAAATTASQLDSNLPQAR
jgi:hypothetical protein